MPALLAVVWEACLNERSYILHITMQIHALCLAIAKRDGPRLLLACWAVTVALFGGSAHAIILPPGFDDVAALSGLEAPATMRFSPDGRLFVAERISGRLLVAHQDVLGNWVLNAQPFYTFDIPKDSGGNPARHRSSGVRDIAFDPNFATNGRVYAFYMKNSPRQNRVVRITASASNPDIAAAASELLLMSLPFNSSGASGSHNGGALEFGTDDMLYVTTGDGWSGGDPVQSLTTFTGKVLRIGPDGSIPSGNPFFSQTTGDYRAIYALGLRNPFSISSDAGGQIYVNETTGSNKADLYKLQPSANYSHQGFSGIGTLVAPWVDAAAAGGKLATGGAWYPTGGTFPSNYHGSYFVALWGSNNGNPGQINQVLSPSNSSVATFATDVGGVDPNGGRLKPILTRVGPEGDLYYMLTTYDTDDGRVRRIRWLGTSGTAAPTFSPLAGTSPTPIDVTLATSTSGAAIHYTLDGSDPTQTSPIYSSPILIAVTTLLRARAFKSGLQPSSIVEALYDIGTGSNLPPVADAGPDQTVSVGDLVTLNGSNSTDPDGDDLLLLEEWNQIAGPPATIIGGDDSVAFFTPTIAGRYGFEISVSDGLATSTDAVFVTVVECLADIRNGLVAQWSFDEGFGAAAGDSSGRGHSGTLVGATWSPATPDLSNSALELDGTDDAVQVAPFDVAGQGLTIAFWFQADDFAVQDARFLSKANGVQDANHWWMVSTLAQGPSTRLRFRLKAGGSTSVLIANSGDLQPGSWHHVAATYDGAEMRLSLDDVEVGVQAKTGSIDVAPNVPVTIGNQPVSLDRPFDGRLDEVRIYDRALSFSEVTTLRTGSRACNGPIFSEDFEGANLLRWGSIAAKGGG